MFEVHPVSSCLSFSPSNLSAAFFGSTTFQLLVIVFFLFFFLFIKTYLYRVVHNQIIIILFYSVALLLANGMSSDNLNIKHYLRHDMCPQSFLKRMEIIALSIMFRQCIPYSRASICERILEKSKRRMGHNY